MKCAVCKEEIHPKRLEILPGTKTCAKHSVAEKYKCMTVQYGEGDHTYDDVIILKEEDAWKIEQSEKKLRENIENESKKEFEIDLTISSDLDDNFVEVISENIDVLEDKDPEDDFSTKDPYVE